ncbi:hypothetical protein GQ43DRAFT_308066 [Delitschia confertaspora ATCC 74209]|uniref:Uncharacterized protein n=1 Tax=Delitschia confertaspora ATCC 74209 TaxID=1513339 RepID=A0A9P4N038_9PLEO|nr:hypothetical protein GQ43DRAFT_308066 [Delitschia confertaspora ATCC 74209]
MAPIAPAVMENKRRLLPLPIELRHEIYGYLSVPGPDNRPTTTLSPFRKSTHVVGKVTTTIVGVCTPSMGLLRMGDCFEAAEYVEWLRNFGHELHVHIAFKAALPAGFSVGLEGWKFKVEKGLEKLATRHRAMKKWPRRVWVDWKPKVHQSTKKDIEIGKIVAGMVKTVLTGGGERIGRRDDRVGVMLYIFTVSNGMLLGARAIFAELMTVGLDGVGWGKVELSLYVDNMFAGQANSDGQIVYPNGMVRCVR